jgi:hypothetical protein
MVEDRKLLLMALADGEPDAVAVAQPRLDPVETAYVADLCAERALLRAAFPAETVGLEPARATLEAAFAARQHPRAPSARAMWLPLAASVLTAIVVGGGTVLIAERRAEDTASRAIAAFRADQQLQAAAFVEAMDRHASGQSVAWINPESATSGSVTPLRTFRAADGRWCREYRKELVAPGGTERSLDIACREGDAWLPTSRADADI